MQSNFDDFIFFFVPGSCGAFLNSVFSYYINQIQTPHLKYKGFVNPETGDCHSNEYFVKGPQWSRYGTHWKDQIPPGAKVIAINFDDDDKKFIFRMMFHKSWKSQLTEKMLSEFHNGKYKHLGVSNFAGLESEMLKNLDDFIFPNWKDQLDAINPVLTVTYKQIMFGDLNKIVADFFNVDVLPDAEQYIEEYRLYNSKYFVS